MLNVITLPAPGAASLVFAGLAKDKLLVVIESTIIDAVSGQSVREFNVGGSIYIVSDVGAKGFPSRRMNIKHLMKGIS